MNKILPIIILSMSLMACDAEPIKTPIQYNDEIILSNGIINVGVSPAAGRIVSFGKVNGENLLWRNTESEIESQKKNNLWINRGGDKIWPAVEYCWPRVHGYKNWSPDKDIDGKAWNVVELSTNRIVIESPKSNDLKIIIRREIEIENGKPAIAIKNTLERQSYSPFPVCLWSITQVKPPRYCLLDIAREPARPRPFVTIIGNKINARIINGTALKFSPPSKRDVKIGTFGEWIAAVYPDCVFWESTEYHPTGCYPDNASIECYWNNAVDAPANASWSPNYVELEPMGISVHLKPGERTSNVTKWEIINIPSANDVEGIVNILNKK